MYFNEEETREILPVVFIRIHIPISIRSTIVLLYYLSCQSCQADVQITFVVWCILDYFLTDSLAAQCTCTLTQTQPLMFHSRMTVKYFNILIFNTSWFENGTCSMVSFQFMCRHAVTRYNISMDNRIWIFRIYLRSGKTSQIVDRNILEYKGRYFVFCIFVSPSLDTWPWLRGPWLLVFYLVVV